MVSHDRGGKSPVTLGWRLLAPAARPDPEAIAAAWSRVGAGFNVVPADEAPDLEMLLIDTVRAGRSNARLFVAAATWLASFGFLVARHRLRRLAALRLRGADRAALGLLLETVREATGTRHFNDAIRACAPAVRAEPLFHAHASHPALRERAERTASALSRRWGVLAEPIELKPEMLRAPSWIARGNPSLALRADLDGDLRASILAEIEHDPSAGESELELARRCGATRTAVRMALQRLELAGHVSRERVGRRMAIRAVV